ncbi:MULTISPECIES: hypothetical protein [unclassified Nostoc]|uniref:hypothetical protein n=1 Tax=unclassified Nostoc TaxID=2593658 RepID=UPI00083DC6B1|nr:MULTISPECIES: hypothetical protein [unclassified Nostoc]AVH68120.1 hypothetical protein NPM_10029 [Nostoc sp. 'Peltigera membranacea cyanobiont' N6]ODG98364.1 hypothetical protein A4S05_00620 [Nostoc sp. KVJ20]
MIKLLLKYAPNSIVDAVNDISLAELDKRGLIVWADAPPLEPEDENSAFNLASRFTEVTPNNLLEVFMTIAQIYTNYGDCLALKYLMELSAEYFGLIGVE